MADEKTNNLEREYTIPLRNQWKRVPRYKKANKAIKAIKEFLAKHMKIENRDLNKIKIDKYLNEEIWFRGIRKPPSKIKVKAIREGDIVKVELVEMKNKLKFKKLREEKLEQKAEELIKEKEKGIVEKAKEKAEEPLEKKEDEKESEEKKADAKEKKSAVVESTEKMEKDIAKKAKHDVGGKTKQPKRQQRKALAK